MTAPHGPGARRASAAAAAATVAALALAACSSGSSSQSGAASSGALDLQVGTILPQTGSLATLGPPEIEAVNLAESDINAANSGLKITVTQKDSGDTTTNIATQSVTSLLSQGVGSIVGAASSGVSMTVIDQIVQANTVMMSPANTSPDFTTYKDNGYYWRTAPSDVLQGQILGTKIVEDGHKNVALLYLNDPYGIGLAKNIKKTLLAAGVNVSADVTYDPNASNFTSDISKALAKKPDALVVIGFEESKVIYSELATSGFDFSNLYGTDGNYGLIQPGDSPDIAGTQYSNPGVKAPAEFQKRLQQQTTKDGAKPLTVFSYAAESYDGTVLVSLAALQGKGTDGTTIRDNLQSVSTGGTKCTTYKECADLVNQGTDIDYDGESGPISFDKNGDVSEASVSIYKYSQGNKNAWVKQIEGKL